MASWACGAEGADLLVRREVLPCSRIFWTCAERLGLMVVGGGGTWAGRERMVRWRALRVVRSVVRAGSGEERVLLVGSMEMGRRVNVSSIVGERRVLRSYVLLE